MDRKAFIFNGTVKYQAGGVYSMKKQLNEKLSNLHILVESSGGQFAARLPDFLGSSYRLPIVKSAVVARAWHSRPMQFWQNQLNFAVWCATGGCGVSATDHLAYVSKRQGTDAFTQALYTFHVYYQIRRILAEICAPLPQDDRAWRAFDNPYDRRAYERICREFDVSPDTNWRQDGKSMGLGVVYLYYTNNRYHPYRHNYDPNRMSFTKKTTNSVLHIDYIEQDPSEAYAWSTFILDKSEGFTHPGVERLNDSIRTYAWAILGAQAQTRTDILGTGTAFDAQKQFLANVEDAISSPVDLPSAIKRYESVLQYACSKVDYVFGIGLYMSPSDMQLHIGLVQGYNNEIVIASESQHLGQNSEVNASVSPRHARPPPLLTDAVPKEHGQPGPSELHQPASLPPEKQIGGSRTLARSSVPSELQQHDEEKAALVLGGVIVGLVALWLSL